MERYVFCHSSRRCKVCKISYNLMPVVRVVTWYYEKQGTSTMREVTLWICAKCSTEHVVQGEHIIVTNSDRLLLNATDRLITPNMSPEYALAEAGLILESGILQDVLSHSSVEDNRRSVTHGYQQVIAEPGKSLLYLLIGLARINESNTSDIEKINADNDFVNICNILYSKLYIADAIKLGKNKETVRYRQQFREVLLALIYSIYSSNDFYKVQGYISRLITGHPATKSPLLSETEWIPIPVGTMDSTIHNIAGQIKWKNQRDGAILSRIGSLAMNFCIDALLAEGLSDYCGGKANALPQKRALIMRTIFLGSVAKDLLGDSLLIIAPNLPDLDVEDYNVLAEIVRTVLGGVFLYGIYSGAANPLQSIFDIINERILKPNMETITTVSTGPIREVIRMLERYEVNGYAKYRFPIKLLDSVINALRTFDNFDQNIAAQLMQLKISLIQYRSGDLMRGILGVNDCLEVLVERKAIHELRRRADQTSGEAV